MSFSDGMLIEQYHKMSDIEKIQYLLKRIDNGWNSGSVFEIERMLGDLIPDYNEVHNRKIEGGLN